MCCENIPLCRTTPCNPVCTNTTINSILMCLLIPNHGTKSSLIYRSSNRISTILQTDVNDHMDLLEAAMALTSRKTPTLLV